MSIANRDVTLSVVFRLDDSDEWHEWSTGHRTVSEALVSAEALVRFPPVPEIRFDRVTRTTERLSLHDLAAEDEPAASAVVVPPTDRATLSGRLARRVAEDASAVRMDLYEDLATYARQTGNAGLQHSQIRDHLAEFLFEGLLRRLAVEAHDTGTQQQDADLAERKEQYAVAIHDAMESDLSLADQEPGYQALFARAAEAAMALADAGAQQQESETSTAPLVETVDDDEGDELVCVDMCGSCDACGMEPFGTPAEGWREAARFLRRTARTSGKRHGALHGAQLIEAELRRQYEAAYLAEPAPVAQQPACCDHPADAHQPGEDPVTPGICAACPDDDAHHDYEAAGAQQQPAAEACSTVEVDGETVLVRGSGEMTEQDRKFFGEIVRAAKRKYAAEHGAGQQAAAADGEETNGSAPVVATSPADRATMPCNCGAVGKQEHDWDCDANLLPYRGEHGYPEGEAPEERRLADETAATETIEEQS
ncbi:hypothetical protein ACWDBD_17135 [Streptomyces sp. NPDC001118]